MHMHMRMHTYVGLRPLQAGLPRHLQAVRGPLLDLLGPDQQGGPHCSGEGSPSRSRRGRRGRRRRRVCFGRWLGQALPPRASKSASQSVSKSARQPLPESHSQTARTSCSSSSSSPAPGSGADVQLGTGTCVYRHGADVLVVPAHVHTRKHQVTHRTVTPVDVTGTVY